MASSIGFILGTGWGKIIKDVKIEKEISYSKLFGKNTTVPGHQGKVIFAKLNGKKIIFLSGRFHTYEDYSPYEVTKTICYLHEQGVKKIIITSAVGALNPKFQVGDLVILSDLLTFFCPSPLIGPKFQDMSEPFSKKLIKLAENSIHQSKINYQKGVYAFMKGPQFETYADKMALRALGADIVGSSTVHETIMAKHLGMEVLGLSLVTNLAFVKHSHEEVLKAAKNQEEKLYIFIKNLIRML